jgi:hypothetical protein
MSDTAVGIGAEGVIAPKLPNGATLPFPPTPSASCRGPDAAGIDLRAARHTAAPACGCAEHRDRAHRRCRAGTAHHLRILTCQLANLGKFAICDGAA